MSLQILWLEGTHQEAGEAPRELAITFRTINFVLTGIRGVKIMKLQCLGRGWAGRKRKTGGQIRLELPHPFVLLQSGPSTGGCMTALLR